LTGAAGTSHDARMQLTLDIDDAGRFVCTLAHDATTALVTASTLPAADDLLAAIEDARDTGYGECVWEEAGGDYRWMLRKRDDVLTVVVLWSSGTLTGWEHVFRGECDLEWLAGRVGAELERQGIQGSAV
jgi:hypothetical protein